MALPKIHRLRHRQDFNAVYRKGVRRTTRHLTLRALYQPRPVRSGIVGSLAKPLAKSALSPIQFGISVSSKVSKRAVVRNRIRRRIQAILTKLIDELCPGWQVVVVVHPQAIQCDYQQFLQELKQLLEEAEVFHGNS